MTAYYNEFDPKAAAWLRELIADGLIAPGDVDERSIVDVAASDLKGYCQHHFFAGIGGWSYALRLAGWPDDRSVWTASLPCQPFSVAGKGLGKQDERHLLPHFISLVAQCHPAVLFGEQVSSAIKHYWLDDLYAEMEANNYAVGSVVIGAHSVGAAHIRQRLYWVADSNKQGLEGREAAGRSDKLLVGEGCLVNGMADSLSQQREQQPDERSSSLFGASVQQEECVAGSSDIRAASDGGMVYTNESRSQQRVETAEAARYRHSSESAGSVNGMGNAESYDQQRDRQREACDGSQESLGRSGISRWICYTESQRRAVFHTPDIRPANGKVDSLADTSCCVTEQSPVLPTSGIDWIYCRDGKYRPIESGLKPLVDGVPRGMVHSSDPRNTQEARAVRLKGYGNAIVPTLAAEFIKAYMQC